jgi:polysaccharide export outer membrane protein
MFQVPDTFEVSKVVTDVESNYVIQKNDILALEVFTNKGEKIIDPSIETLESTRSQTDRKEQKYLVDLNGMTKFPMIEEIKIEGMTLKAAEKILENSYSKFYQKPFVKLTYSNKRVVILGAPGGQVIQLVNENLRLTEVLAMAKGINNDAKSHNIRVLRGQQVFVVDFSTIDGYISNNIIIQPNDIIYIEPVRRPFIEGFKDYSLVMSMVTSLATLVLLLSKI